MVNAEDMAAKSDSALNLITVIFNKIGYLLELFARGLSKILDLFTLAFNTHPFLTMMFMMAVFWFIKDFADNGKQFTRTRKAIDWVKNFKVRGKDD